jgi:arylsulfatase A-like enzyme
MTSVAVVVLDTLRYDTFLDHFDWLDGKHFTNAYSTTHWTMPAHASLLTGRYPSEVGVTAKSRSLDCEAPTLPEVLQADGYTTRMFSANINLVIQSGWDRGFDRTLGMEALDPDSANTLDWREFLDGLDASRYERYLRAVWECLASDVATVPSLRQGLRMARGSDHQNAETMLKRVRHTDFGDREFLLVNLMDTHTPYNPPAPYRSADEPMNATIADAFADAIDDPEAIRQAYDDEATYLSDSYRKLFDVLREDFEYVITLSDHGEMLGEEGMWNHGYGLYPELVHVPLVISGGGIDAETRDEVVSLLDVHRTVAEAMGVSVESRGQDLLGAVESRDQLVEYHGLFDTHRQQFTRSGISDALYDRLDVPLDGFVTADGCYAYQTHDDGFRVTGNAIEDPEASLKSLRGDIVRQEVAPEETDVSELTRQRLKDLGYA